MDNSIVFEQLLELIEELYQKLDNRFHLTPVKSTESLKAFSRPNSNVTGSLTAFTGQK
ncbi:MAG: hypothetical protein ACOC0N_08605 [Chroococcales cyanobacterium]